MTAKEDFIRICRSYGLKVWSFDWGGYISVNSGNKNIKKIRMCEIPAVGVEEMVAGWVVESTWL